MKIINKKRFFKSISIIITFVFFFTLFCINRSLSHTETTYKTIKVIPGDNLWNIAKQEKINNQYFKNKDIRTIVDEIKYLNYLTNSNVNIGDELKIPIIL